MKGQGRDGFLDLFGAWLQLQKLLFFDGVEAVTFDVSFEDGVVVSQTHFPVVNDVLIDGDIFGLILVNVQGFDVVFHE